MSDYSVSIVPKLSSYSNNKVKAKEILDWLVSKDIVKSIPSDCVLGSSSGYPISDGAKQVVIFSNDLPFNLVTNGLDLITNRQVFDTGENFIDELICPNCHINIAFEDWDIGAWSNGESNNLVCSQCKHIAEIHNFTFKPDWGFSDLGFTFWNWPVFTDDFLEEFKFKLGCEISIVSQHI
jgi:hypothetical protein